MSADIVIPSNLKPVDGRFRCGPSKIRPEEYFAVYRKNGATWTNTFSGLDPNTKYRFQFIHNGIGNLKEEVTSSASLNNGTPVVDSTDLVNLTTD